MQCWHDQIQQRLQHCNRYVTPPQGEQEGRCAPRCPIENARGSRPAPILEVILCNTGPRDAFVSATERQNTVQEPDTRNKTSSAHYAEGGHRRQRLLPAENGYSAKQDAHVEDPTRSCETREEENIAGSPA